MIPGGALGWPVGGLLRGSGRYLMLAGGPWGVSGWSLGVYECAWPVPGASLGSLWRCLEVPWVAPGGLGVPGLEFPIRSDRGFTENP